MRFILQLATRAQALTGKGKGKSRAWPCQHGGAAETGEGNVLNRIAAQARDQDPRQRASRFGKRLHAGGRLRAPHFSADNVSTSAANLLEDLLIFFSVKAAQREPAEDIHFV